MSAVLDRKELTGIMHSLKWRLGDIPTAFEMPTRRHDPERDSPISLFTEATVAEDRYAPETGYPTKAESYNWGSGRRWQINFRTDEE